MKLDRAVSSGALVALVACAGTRLATLEWSDSYPHLTFAPWFGADEGWYLKSGMLLGRHGVLSQPLDLTAWTHNPLWSLVVAGLDATAARGPWLARLFVFCCWGAGLAILYRLVRTALERPVALLVCVTVAASSAELALARIARPYAPPVTLILFALWLWVARPPRPRTALVSLSAAMLATALKVLFVHGLVATAILWLLEARRASREGRGRDARLILLSVSSAVGLAAALFVTIRILAPADVAAYEREAIVGRANLEELTPLALLQQELRAIVTRPFVALHAGGLASAACLGLVLLALRRRLGQGPAGPPSRMTVALATWLVTGTAMLGFSSYQPRRFFLFALPCLAALALASLARAMGPRRAVPAVTAAVLLQLGIEAPSTVEWLGQPDPTAQDRVATDIARRVTAHDDAPVLMGRISAFVATYDRRIRPLEIGFLDVTGTRLCARVAAYRPGHAILDGRDAADEEALRCPGVVTRVRREAIYRRRGDEPSSPIVLVRLEYAHATSGSSSRRTSPDATAHDSPSSRPRENRSRSTTNPIPILETARPRPA